MFGLGQKLISETFQLQLVGVFLKNLCFKPKQGYVDKSQSLLKT